MIALMFAFILGCDDGDTTKTTTSTEGNTETTTESTTDSKTAPTSNTNSETSTTTVAITTSVGAAANVVFQAVGESITCMWTGTAWAILSYGSGATGSNIVGTQDVT